jgi:hypothetical protein
MRSRSRLSTLPAAVVFAGLLVGAPAFAGTLDVAPEATWSGDFGLVLGLTDTAPSYVETDTPADEVRYVVRFYFNADTVSLGAGGSLALFRAFSDALVPIVTALLQSGGDSGRELVFTVKTDAAEASTAGIPVGSGWHLLELDWAAAGPGANDGFLHTRLDDAPTAGLDLLDNDQSTIGVARWGAVVVAATPSGTLWLDDFASRRTGPIGPVLAGSLDLDGNGALEALTDGLLFLRSLFGFTGATLITSAVGNGCRYCTAPAIQSRLVALQAVLDIDDNGAVAPLTDGLLVLRFLFGFTGTTLTSGAIGGGAARSTPVSVAAYLDTLE